MTGCEEETIKARQGVKDTCEDRSAEKIPGLTMWERLTKIGVIRK
jgi:hypothetical protein